MGSYQEASNDYDMLKGCVNRIFVTDDMEELPRLYSGAMYHFSRIYQYGCDRLIKRAEEKRDEDTAVKGSRADAAGTDQDAGSDT